MKTASSHINLKKDLQFLHELRKLLETPGGRDVFYKLLAAYGIRQSTFTGNALTGAHAQGMQNAGLLLEDLITTAAFGLFLEMLKEHEHEQTA